MSGIPMTSVLNGKVIGRLNVQHAGPKPDTWRGISEAGGPRYFDEMASRGRRYLEVLREWGGEGGAGTRGAMGSA